MSIELAWPYAWLALPLPWLVRRFMPPAVEQPGVTVRVPFFAALAETGTTPVPDSRRRLLPAAAAWLLLTLAAARPQFVGEAIQFPVTGRDLLLAVDISESMQTDDMILNRVRVDRLTAVKAVAEEFIARRKGDRLGLLLFGQQAYLQTPLTFDRETVRTFLNEAVIGLAGQKTAIGDAIGLAVKRLRDQSPQQRVLILLTDGANTAGEVRPLQAAELAAREGVRIYTVGIGADELTVNTLFGQRRINPSQSLDEDTLQAIAGKTGGRYFRARDSEGLAAIYTLLDELEPSATDEETVRPVKELYPWPLAGALLFTVSLAAGRLRWPGLRPARHSVRRSPLV
jgi:Ca-activated chloride channel family protein